MTGTISLTIEMDDLKKFENEAKIEYKNEYKEYDSCDNEGLFFNLLNMDEEEWTFEDGDLVISGDVPKLGYISLRLTIPNDISVEIIEYKVKQLNKLKTVLEAVK